MYKILQLCARRSRNPTALQSVCSLHPAGHVRIDRNFAQNSSVASSAPNQPSVNFDQLIAGRRDQAGRTILVQVNSEKSYPELLRYCSQYGSVASAQHYQHDDQHYIVLEYEDANGARSAVDAGTFNDDFAGTVVRSPFLWFRAGPRAKLEPKSPLNSPASVDISATEVPLAVIDGSRAVVDAELNESMRQAADIGEQMRQLHRRTGLNEVGTRLRFLAARQIESALHGMFPHACAYPFGSSVNGFGRLGCDLDMILRLSREETPNAEARLVFHAKEQLSNGRSQTQRQMESISDVLQLFLPGVCHVRRILQARVPIIKYRHEHLDLEVDLSMSNLSGVYMSELLYMFGQLDDRVQPLIFTVRRWAQSVGLTNASPGRWISNFSLTCLVIFYLQQLPVPILPAINTLIQAARRPADVRITEDGINCTFLRDIRTVRQLHRQRCAGAENRDDLAKLLVDFFEFYAQMNFADCAISLNEGRTVGKPEHAAIYIVNPLEVHLNVSKNVSAEECERFRIEVRNAAWSLDSFPDASTGSEWGVLGITRAAASAAGVAGQQVIRPSMFFRPRLVEVSDLFGAGEAGDDGGAQPVERKKVTAGFARREPTVAATYKNDTVRGMVTKIQRKGRADLQQLEAQMNGKATAGSTTGGGGGGTLPTRARKR